mmetsp:Transcript_4300/g.16219  ORF Transcript_4300/g.16219 Transcript_4300/m.16219 type:complete len:276 (-) Transcript_4300:146-973(-)
MNHHRDFSSHLVIIPLLLLLFVLLSTQLILSQSTLPLNAGIIYPIEYNQLSFCSHINYTVFLQIRTQSQFNASKTFDTPVVELPTQTVVPLDANHSHLATTDSVFIDGYYFNSSVFSGQIINISRVDQDAQDMYETVASVLQRYNCRDFYPYMSCNRCMEYYKNWACAVTLPMWNESSLYRAGTVKMCADVCWEVVRKCPVELEFYCPTHDDSFATFDEGCNSLGLNVTSGAMGMHWGGGGLDAGFGSQGGIGHMLRVMVMSFAVLIMCWWHASG